MRRWIRFSLLSALLLLICSEPLAKQIETGSIVGIVSDDFGPVAAASIQAKNTMAVTWAETHADVAGEYNLSSLKAGRCSIWVQAPDQDWLWINEVVVEHGQVTRLDIHLPRARAIPTT